MPSGASRAATPAAKSLMSGTCARTLFPRTRSACPRSRARRAPSSAPKNSVIVSTPRATAASATFSAGSIPSTGTRFGEEVLQEIPVVRRELDDEALRPEREPLAHLLDVRPRVLDPRVRVRRKVRVLAEDLLGRGELGNLGEPAALADPDVERIERLAGLELLVGQHRLAERRLAEIDHSQPQRRCAMAADGGAGRGVPVHGCERLRLGHLLHSLHGTRDVDLCAAPRWRQRARPRRTHALCPPRPIAFDRATSTSARRASLGT